MSDSMSQMYDPTNEGSFVFSGRKADGSVTVITQVTFTVDDEVGMRAGALIDPDAGDVAPDWGIEHAVRRQVTEVVRTADWKAAGLTPVGASLTAWPGSGFLPGGQFVPR